jgi:light-regulated signal transduction histidine kinase (bacteriophytochrome)
VLCDRERVLQTLSNLVDNAIKFAPVDSRIVIEAAMHGPDVCFSVRDQGPGIPVVLLSGEATLARRAADLGVAGYLRKPVDLGSLVAMVNRLVPHS